MSRYQVRARLHRPRSRTASPRSPKAMLESAAPLLVMAGLISSTVGLGVAAVVLGVGGGWSLIRRRRPPDRRTRLDELASLVEHIGRSLRSGAVLRQALEESTAGAPGALAAELAVAVAELDAGVDAGLVMSGWADRVIVDEAKLVAAALCMAVENEAGTTQALDGVASTIRARASLEGEVKALAAPATASMKALAVLPLGLVGLDLMTVGRVSSFLVQEPIGKLCLVVGLGLNLAGWLWMRQLTSQVQT